MSAIRTGKTPVLTRSSPNPVTPPTPPHVAKFPKTPVIRFVSGSPPTATPPAGPRSSSPRVGRRNMAAACALVIGVARGGRCAACGGTVLRSGQSLACDACVVYGHREAA
jgi:hypothetical protein